MSDDWEDCLPPAPTGADWRGVTSCENSKDQGWGNDNGGTDSNKGGWGNDNGGSRNNKGGWGNDNGGSRNNKGGWGNDNGGSRNNKGGWGNDRGGSSNNKGGWGNDRGGGSNNKGGWGNDRGGSGKNSEGWGNNEGNRRPRNDKCEFLKVPTRMVGKIIGRSGFMIDELQLRSSARIHVTKDTEGDQTLVKIFGDDTTIGNAKDMINELIEDKPKQAPLVAKEPPAPVVPRPAITNMAEFLKECAARVEAEWNKLPPIIKQFYEEHPEVTAMSDEEVEDFRASNHNIVVERTFPKEDSKPIPKPVTTFQHAFHNYPEILEEIRKAGFQRPSPIQSQAWPVLLSGEDLIGIAQTGTGKTLAFLLPALIHIDGQTIPREERGGPAVLIMAPTRELALQIDKEVKKYEYRGITSVCVYGGGDRKAQVDVVTRGVDIVIATPGRMNDLNEHGYLNVETITYVVLDEADRMLDMGFEPQIRKVMYSLRPTRQCIMTSATWPPGVRRLADSYMKDPIQIYVGSLDLAATHSVTQVIQLIEEKEKEEVFFDFVRNMGPDEKIIVFCCTKARADHLTVELLLKEINCASLHGNRDQSDREQAVADIADGTVRILIATDVASRGLDIDDVTHVLNYDFPKNIEEYVHRVGRTGRAGKTGESISYFTKNDWSQASELIKILEEAQQFVPQEIYSMAERFAAMKERRERSQTGNRRGVNRFEGGSRRY